MIGVRQMALTFALLAAGCGATATATSTVAREPKVKLSVADAKLPYQVLRARGGSQLEEDAFFAELGKSRAICIGEAHTDPHHHWSQLHIIEQVSSRFPAAEGLGMEMFQQPFQGVLDDFGQRRIDHAALLQRSGWKVRWGFDYELYRPIIELAVAKSMQLLALNAPKELTKKVARKGLDKLSDADRAKLPEMVLDDAQHRAWFEAIMEGHPGGDHHSKEETAPDDSAERIYAAQVLWDESMADAAARWLAADSSRRLFIIAGNGHCHDSAIGNRLKRRGITEVTTVHPIVDDGEGNVAKSIAEPIVDYLFVMGAPK